MEWRSEAIVLTSKAQGENHSRVTVFARDYGLRSAVVYGGQGRGKVPILQCGNLLDVRWRGKTEDARGLFEFDLLEARAAQLFSQPLALGAMSSAAELLLHVLPEGEALPGLYDAASVLFGTFAEEKIWPAVLARWEVGVLGALGHGLTLDRCAATARLLEDGAELCFVSPKSGTAVSYEAGLPYKDKLHPLPPFLIGMGEPTLGDVAAALDMTGFFLEARLLLPIGRSLPEARQVLARKLRDRA